MGRRLYRAGKAVCVLAAFFAVFLVQPPVRRLSLNRYAPVKPVGTVPPAFETLVRGNLLCNAYLSPDGFYTVSAAEGTHIVRRYGYDGALLPEFQCVSPLLDPRASLWGAASAGDGGTLVLWRADARYDNDLGKWRERCAALEKYDAGGALAWRYAFPEPVPWPAALFVREGYCYLLGDCETPATKKEGVGSPTDLLVFRITSDGGDALLQTYGGDFDTSFCAVAEGDGFRLYGLTQSKDGDFAASPDGYGGSISMLIDRDLRLASWRKEADFFSAHQTPEGPALKGLPVYGFPVDGGAGTLLCAVMYEDCYLTVSNNITGINYEQMDIFPYISTLPFYFETVYSGYDRQSGRLMWRAAVSLPK